MNNLPDGVDEYTANAPWNEVEKEKETYKLAIWWSVDDFEGRAEELFDNIMDEDLDKCNPLRVDFVRLVQTKCKTWKDLYDESKFEDALDNMINHHDACIGITWDSIDYYLDDMCIKNLEDD